MEINRRAKRTLRLSIKPAVRFALAVIVGVSLVGCAKHNRPHLEDYTDYSISTIISKIKCETAIVVANHSLKKYKIVIGVDNLKIIRNDIKLFVKSNAKITKTHKTFNTLQSRYKKLLKETIIALELATIEFNSYFQILKKLENSNDTALVENVNKKYRISFVKESKLKEEKAQLDDKLTALGLKHKSNEVKYKNFKWKLHNKNKAYRNSIDFLETLISYNFIFDITEKNIAKINAKLSWPITHGSKNENPSLGSDLKRQSLQTLEVEANFNELIMNNCTGKHSYKAGKSPELYPIEGDTGAGAFITEFIQLREENPRKGKTETFSDKVFFTTQLDGGIKPSLKLTPIIESTVNITGDLSAQRIDKHNVTLTIRRPK